MTRMHRVLSGYRQALLLAHLLGLAQALWACPLDRALTVVVPYSAGGSVDGTTRVLAESLAKSLRRPIIVRNVPGASGLLAVREVLAAQPDGCTVLAGSLNTVVLVPILNPNANFRSSDLRPLAMLGTTQYHLLTNRRLNAQNMKELHALSNTMSRPLAAGHPGRESLQALALSLLESRTGLRITQIPYSGAAPLLNDLVGGHVDVAVVAGPAAMRLAAHGDAKRIAIISDLDGLEHLESWAGWFVPASVPRQVTIEVENALAEQVNDPGLIEKFKLQDVDLSSASDQAGFARRVALDEQRYGELLRLRRKAD